MQENTQVKFKNFILDPFQVKAVEAIEKNHSVVVSAATGTGKTLIADYAINKWKNLNKRIIYTAPIKALSNQKYRDFKAEYGEKNVGIMTGDVVINPEAHLIIMTTEIYRNMLMTNDPIIKTIAYVIFDEIHFMSDKERGTIWEESIIFAPNDIRVLCLSATIPNAKEFADWIASIKDHEVEVVTYEKRAVPLSHFLYDVDYGVITAQQANELSKNNQMPDYYKIMRRKRQRKKSNEKPKVPKHSELVKILKQEGKLPCIFFAFSRRGCEEKAEELAYKNDFLTPEEKQKVIRLFNQEVKEEYRYLESVKLLRNVLQKGIGVHHAGLLPALKEVVEELFAQGIIRVLYATETFAVGINMPAKSVAFSSLVKYDGVTFNLLRSKEYFQMAGRAGRRGIDKEGFVISMLERRNELPKILELISSDSEPIISQFRLEPNTVLNMVNNYNEEEIDTILKSNFDYFIKKRDDVGIRIKARFNNLVKRLKKFKYINEDDTLTDKGKFATQIYSNELLVTELFSGSIHKQLTENEMCVLIASIVYEFRRSDSFYFDKKNKKYQWLAGKVIQNRIIEKELNVKAIRDLWKVINAWANGCEFEELSEYSEYQEGDYIRLFRQMVDCMNQIRKATQDRELEEKIVNCMNKIYRDVVKFEF
ncbi:DEAD/DEAH box helicase [Candidatus Woesearchaeota archaeon]|nr:DEAD/DEAH box helicase [Candidatus Woesearchaeota archaeon]